jgi:hypothetical protein
MTDFRNWDDLVEDANTLGGLACYKLDVLLSIYGVDRAGTQANTDIVNSLARRGYGIQPRQFTHQASESWVRLYAKNSAAGQLLEAVLDVSPAGHKAIREFILKQEHSEAITQLIALAKTIAKDT